MKLVNTLKVTTLAGLALLASSCAKTPPEAPTPIERKQLTFKVEGKLWTAYDIDRHKEGVEVAIKRRESDGVETIYFAPGFRDTAKEWGYSHQLREMTPQMQAEISTFAKQYADFVDAINQDVYAQQLARYNTNKN